VPAAFKVIDTPNQNITSLEFLTALPKLCRDGVVKPCIYPGVNQSTKNYETPWGIKTRDDLKKIEATRPLPNAQRIPFFEVDIHDSFEESRPRFKDVAIDKKPIMGTFKIKGTVFFLPYGDIRAQQWADGFLSKAQRDVVIEAPFRRAKIKGSYSPGPLLMRGAEMTLRDPNSGLRVMTRYEAGEFSHVEFSDVMIPLGMSFRMASGAPAPGNFWRSRPYPGYEVPVTGAA
jgi:hypothetical protein